MEGFGEVSFEWYVNFSINLANTFKVTVLGQGQIEEYK